MIYLAAPYTHEDPEIMKRRALDALEIGAQVLVKFPDELIFIATAYGQMLHDAAGLYQVTLPHTEKEWRMINNPLIANCDRFMIAMIEGWDQSVGVEKETQLARRFGKPISYIRTDQTIAENP